MKYFLFILALFGSVSAFACKPAPLASCRGQKTFTLDLGSLKALKGDVSLFQSLLTESISSVEPRHSCFNNFFAIYYLDSLKPPRTCTGQIEAIAESIRELINSDSDERKSVESEGAGQKLNELSQKVNASLTAFTLKHRR